MTNVALITGSLRENSFSLQLANNLAKMFPEGYNLNIVPIDKLEFYNPDLEKDGEAPESWVDFRNELSEHDAVLFITPEYNRSIPGVLKNAIDVGSRPPAENKWSGKPAAIISHSPSNYGGFGANHHLRQALVFSNMSVVQAPEIYLSKVAEVLDENGNINNDHTKQYLQKLVDAFVELIERSK